MHATPAAVNRAAHRPYQCAEAACRLLASCSPGPSPGPAAISSVSAAVRPWCVRCSREPQHGRRRPTPPSPQHHWCCHLYVSPCRYKLQGSQKRSQHTHTPEPASMRLARDKNGMRTGSGYLLNYRGRAAVRCPTATARTSSRQLQVAGMADGNACAGFGSSPKDRGAGRTDARKPGYTYPPPTPPTP